VLLTSRIELAEGLDVPNANSVLALYGRKKDRNSAHRFFDYATWSALPPSYLRLLELLKVDYQAL